MNEFKLKLPNGITLSPTLFERDLEYIKVKNVRNMHNGFVWYDLNPVDIDNKSITFSMCFFQGTIYSVTIAIHNPELYGNSWNDFTQEKEIARFKDTQSWLLSHGYEVGQYAWGNIWAGFDSKGGFGSVSVRFVL